MTSIRKTPHTQTNTVEDARRKSGSSTSRSFAGSQRGQERPTTTGTSTWQRQSHGGNSSRQGDDSSISSAATTVQRIAVPDGLLKPFIAQKLRAEGYINRSGNYCFELCVGKRLSKLEQFASAISRKVSARLFFKVNANDHSKNSVAMVSNTIEELGAAIDYLVALNDKLKLSAGTTERIPLKTKRIDLVFGLVEEIGRNVDFLAVSVELEGTSVVFQGPSGEVAAAVKAFRALYRPYSTVREQASAKSGKQKAALDRTACLAALHERFPTENEEEEEEEEEDTAVDIEVMPLEPGMEAALVVEQEVSLRALNHQVKPPSRRETVGKGRGASGQSKGQAVNSLGDYEVEPGQMYAVVTELFGGKRAQVEIVSTESTSSALAFRTSIAGRISGAMSRRLGSKNKAQKCLKGSNRLSKGAVVIVCTRDFERGIVDIITKVPSNVVRSLVRASLIPSTYYRDPLASCINQNGAYDGEALYGIAEDDDGIMFVDGGIDFDQL